MLDVQLIEAGFYEISWPEQEAAKGKLKGMTYIRPGKRESVRVFLSADAPDVEVYAGGLKDGRLVYAGPADQATLLPWIGQQKKYIHLTSVPCCSSV
jgi:hypothetical protein